MGDCRSYARDANIMQVLIDPESHKERDNFIYKLLEHYVPLLRKGSLLDAIELGHFPATGTIVAVSLTPGIPG